MRSLLIAHGDSPPARPPCAALSCRLSGGQSESASKKSRTEISARIQFVISSPLARVSAHGQNQIGPTITQPRDRQL